MKHPLIKILFLFIFALFLVGITSGHKLYSFNGRNIEIKIESEQIFNDEYEAITVCKAKLQWSDHRKVFPKILVNLANKYGIDIKRLTQISNDTFRFIISARSRDDIDDLLKELVFYFG